MKIADLPIEARDKLTKLYHGFGASFDSKNELNDLTGIGGVWGFFEVAPLHYAAWQGDCELVQILIQNGAELNLKDNFFDRTPLFYAAQYGRSEVCKLLLANGAKFDWLKDSPKPTVDGFERDPLASKPNCLWRFIDKRVLNRQQDFLRTEVLLDANTITPKKPKNA